MYEGKLIMYACIIRETFVFTVFRRVFHSILKLELCRHACRRRDQIIPTCRYGKNMPTTALFVNCFKSFLSRLFMKRNYVDKWFVVQFCKQSLLKTGTKPIEYGYREYRLDDYEQWWEWFLTLIWCVFPVINIIGK